MLWIPGGICFEEVVEEREQFSHAGDDRDLIGFSGFEESLVEIFDRGIAAGGGAGRHVEDVADGFSTSGNASLAGELSAVVVVGGKSDECSDFLAVERPQFG